MVLPDEFLTHPLCHTADDARYHLAFGLTGQGVHLLQPVANGLFGFVADGTGIEQHDVRLLKLFGQLRTGRLHHGSNHLAVCHIHLAAIGLNVEAFRGQDCCVQCL